MKIERIRTAYVNVPIDPPITMVGMSPFTSVYFILVWIDTDAGITGESYRKKRANSLARWAAGFAAAVLIFPLLAAGLYVSVGCAVVTSKATFAGV